MIYSEIEAKMLVGEDESVPDKASSIKPFIHSSKSQRTSGGGEEGEEDDGGDDEVSEWTIRKSAAAGLDVLATVFHEEILSSLLPMLQERLNHNDWRVKESAILALGAIAEGCDKGMQTHLPNLFPFFLTSLTDEQV